MQPRIEHLFEKKLAGRQLSMTYANNQTFQLWREFMPLRRQIKNGLNTDLFSLQVYPASFSFAFTNPNQPFQKWAAIEVSDFDCLPPEIETFTLTGGLYAVFLYKGLNTDTSIFEYIFKTWLPASSYSIDYRPHFEILGDKYRNNDPDSEEEIWIPIKRKE